MLNDDCKSDKNLFKESQIYRSINDESILNKEDSDTYYNLYEVNINRMITSGTRANNKSSSEHSSDIKEISLDHIPNLDEFILNELIDDNQLETDEHLLEIESSLPSPLYLLEFVLCTCSFMMLYSNVFLVSILISKYNSMQNNHIEMYIFLKLINFISISMLLYIFTSVYTFKSISILTKFLMINAIVFEYKYSTILKYIIIHILSSFVATLVTIGLYYSIMDNVPTRQILTIIFPEKISSHLSLSCIALAVIIHIFLIIILYTITASTTSSNAKIKNIQKIAFLSIIGITFEIILGPIEYIMPNIVLYIGVIVFRGAYDLLNTKIVITYICSLFLIIIVYPLLTLQIKTVWRKKFIKYLEYR